MFLLGASCGATVTLAFVTLSLRRERLRRGGDISAVIREEMRAHPEFQRGYSEASRMFQERYRRPRPRNRL